MALSAFELSTLLITILVAASIIRSTLSLGISPMPSSNKARQVILELVDKTGSGPIADLGSGWGNLLVPVAIKYPQRKVTGYEASLLPWLVTVILKNLLSLKNLNVYRKNFLQADLSKESVILCYLYPAGMSAIANKLSAEKNSTKFIISNNFSLPSYKPKETIQLNDFYRSPIYFYQLDEC